MHITLVETPGRCRWCGCTHFRPCEDGCDWANRRQTLCTACVEVDRLVRSFPGRRTLATLENEAALELARGTRPKARRRKGR